MEAYRPRIRRYVISLVGDSADAEDLTQETFLRAHRERATLRDDAAVEGWLYRIATHVTIDRLRQRARGRAREGDLPKALDVADEHQPSGLTVAEQAEVSTCVQSQIGQLSDEQRAVLLLHDAEGLTDDEIATALGLPRTTVKMRLHRARRKLRAQLEHACCFSRDGRDVLVCEPKAKTR